MTRPDGTGRPPVFSYLRLVGALNTWFVAVFIIFAVWALYLRLRGSNTPVALFFLYLLPLATGTGLLTSARNGHLDLLFGTGVTRRRLWWTAVAYAWAIPLAMAIVVVSVGDRHVNGSLLLRLVAVLLFTNGLAFSAGMVETRYFVAILWLVARFVLFVSPGGMTVLKQLESGEALPPAPLLAIVAVVLPESALDGHMPVPYVLTLAVLGVLGMAGAYHWFCNSDLPGKRS